MTALGIAETFRDYVYGQGKRIHIACPRDEVGREFKAYLADLGVAGGYVRQPYEDEAVATRNDVAKPMRAGYAYHIDNHGSIFPKELRQTVGHLYRLLDAWRAVFPPHTHIQRLHTPVACFRLHHPDPVPDSQVAALRAGWKSARKQLTPYLGGDTAFVHTLVHNDAKRGLEVHVTSLDALVAFEQEVVRTYANTLFVVDEAHSFPSNATDTRSGGGGGDDQDDPHTANWRTVLLAVIGILHAYQERMRLVLLTATPMTNAEGDLYTLLNLLIRNDGIQGEPLLAERAKHTHLDPVHQARLRACVRARVSCFESDVDKPVRLLVDQLWYNVPEAVATTDGFAVVAPSSNHTHVVCAPTQTLAQLVGAFVAATPPSVPSVVVHVHATTMDTDKAVMAYRRAVHDTSASPLARRHVLVAIAAAPHAATVAALAAFARQWQPGVDVVHVLAVDGAVAQVVATNADVRAALYSAASEHRPLWFPRPTHCPTSLYGCARPPQYYTQTAGNLPTFFRTYLSTKATDATCAHDFGIVATPIHNDAIAPGVSHAAGRGVPYAFSKHIRNTWNLRDTDDVAYHPKIDTMMELMERLPGNVFIYTPEPRIHPSQNYARFLVFLKRVVERRFRGHAQSRLRNLHVEVLHKGTIPYLNKHAHAHADTVPPLPTELNERVKRLNAEMLAHRDDVVLIGSQEVMEGLTFKEVRQVHMLDPLWHMAAMDQVMGRTIRLQSHRKRPVAERNVACFLHVTVPADPTDARFGAPTPMQQRRGATAVPPLARYVGDLHAYHRVHKKVGGIARALHLVRTHALDAVYRTWRPPSTVAAPHAAIVSTVAGRTSKKPKGKKHTRPGSTTAAGVDAPTDAKAAAPAAWRVHPSRATTDQLAWYAAIVARRAEYGFAGNGDADGPHSTGAPNASESRRRRVAARMAATVPLPRHLVQNEIDWYRDQVVRLFERAAVPTYTFDDIVARVCPYGVPQVASAEPVAVAFDVDAAHQWLTQAAARVPEGRPPPTRGSATGRTVDDREVEALLEYAAASLPAAVHADLLRVVRYTQFRWHATPMVAPPATVGSKRDHRRDDGAQAASAETRAYAGYLLRVDAASVADRLRACPDVPHPLVKRWASQGHLPLDATLDEGVRKAIAGLPTMALRESLVDLCTPKWVPASTVANVPAIGPATATATTTANSGAKAEKAVTASGGRTAKRTAATGGAPQAKRTLRRSRAVAPSASASASALGLLRVQHVRPEALAYALEDVIRRRLRIEHHRDTGYALVFDDPVYTLEALAAPRPLTAWHTPVSPDGDVRSVPPLAYSTSLPTTLEVTDTLLAAVVHDVHLASEWLRACCRDSRLAAVPLSSRDEGTQGVSDAVDVVGAELAFDALPFEYQDAVLQFVAAYGFVSETAEAQHPLHKMPTTQAALRTIRRGVHHRYAEKERTEKRPPSAETLLGDTFDKTVHARVFCTYPRNPATEQCRAIAYTHTRHTGKTVVKPYAPHTLDAEADRAWTAYFCPVPVVLHDVDVHARFHPSTDARLGAGSQPPIQGPTRFLGYGEVLNYKDQASRSFVYRFVDATQCETTEKAGLPLADDRVLTRIAESDVAYPRWEAVWRRVCAAHPMPELRFCALDPVTVARILYLRSRGAFVRYFFPGVQPQHPRTKQLYAGWRSRKKK